MSYSIANVLVTAGAEKIRRWLAIEIDPDRMRDLIRNKMVRPTTVPQTLEDLRLEQAVAREALGGALDEHVRLASGLKGARLERTISDTFTQRASGEGLLDMMRVELIMGSGGVLSHAPRRVQAAAMLIDAFQPEGVTELAVDSVFMMPHLGVLAEHEPEVALQVFQRDCLVPLGASVAPVGRGRAGEACVRVTLEGGEPEAIGFSEMKLVVPESDGACELTVEPAGGFDVGAGSGRTLTREVQAGCVGIIVDTRGRRPIRLPEDSEEGRRICSRWEESLGLYPKRNL